VGGGVGGLTAAAALLKAGAEPTVLESAAALRKVQVGGSIHLWPNALRALRHVGHYDAVRASVDDAGSSPSTPSRPRRGASSPRTPSR